MGTIQEAFARSQKDVWKCLSSPLMWSQCMLSFGENAGIPQGVVPIKRFGPQRHTVIGRASINRRSWRRRWRSQLSGNILQDTRAACMTRRVRRAGEQRAAPAAEKRKLATDPDCQSRLPRYGNRKGPATPHLGNTRVKVKSARECFRVYTRPSPLPMMRE